MKVTIEGSVSDIVSMAEQIASTGIGAVVGKTEVPPVVEDCTFAPLKLYDAESPDAATQHNIHKVTGIIHDGTNYKVTCVPEARGEYVFDAWTVPCRTNGAFEKDVVRKIAQYFEDAIDWSVATEQDMPFKKPVPTKVTMRTYKRTHGTKDWLERRWEEIMRIDNRN